MKGNSGLDLFVHVKDGKPFLFYILDKKERVVLMSEETKNNYRWVYEYPFSRGGDVGVEQCIGKRCKGASQLFLYPKGKMENVYVFVTEYDDDNKELCAQQPEQCMLWQGVLEKNRQAFSQKYNLRLVTPEGGWAADPLNSLQRIQNWQEDVDFFFNQRKETRRRQFVKDLSLSD